MLLSVGCQPSESSYFQTPFGEHDTIRGSVPVGGRGLVGVADIEAQPGDNVTLLELSVLVDGGADLQSYVLRRRDTNGAGIGFRADDRIGESSSFNAVAHPLNGYSMTHSDGPIQVVVALASSTAGPVVFDHVTLHFTVNGEGQTETFNTGGYVCFEDQYPCIFPSVSDIP